MCAVVEGRERLPGRWTFNSRGWRSGSAKAVSELPSAEMACPAQNSQKPTEWWGAAAPGVSAIIWYPFDGPWRRGQLSQPCEQIALARPTVPGRHGAREGLLAHPEAAQWGGQIKHRGHVVELAAVTAPSVFLLGQVGAA